MEGTGVSRHPRITGQRTSLRAASDGDLDVLASWFADPEVYRWWGGHPLSRDEVAADYTRRRSPEVESFIVEAEGRPVGYLQYWRGTEHSGGLVHGPGPRGTRAGARAGRSAGDG